VSFAFYLIFVFAFALLILYFRRRHLFTDLRDELVAAWEDAMAEMNASSAGKDAGEPLSETEANEIIGWYWANVRPALLLRPDPSSDALASPARLGGDVWFADVEEWPLGPDGEKLEFVAQVDFERLPSLPGFPSQGVARFFVGRDDLWGANWDVPDDSNVKVLWHHGLLNGGRHEPPPHWRKGQNSPFESESVRAYGLALRPEPIDDPPDFYSWQLQERLEQEAGRPGLDAVEDVLMEITEAREFAHRIGGHPSFTQYDWRKRGQHDEFDILLLGLSSDDAIMWGDVGEAGFYIRAVDLERRDFSKVAFYWDCH
jgi:uncharacterized protein YwqG